MEINFEECVKRAKEVAEAEEKMYGVMNNENKEDFVPEKVPDEDNKFKVSLKSI